MHCGSHAWLSWRAGGHMFQAGYPLTKRLLNFIYKVCTLSPV